MLNIFLIIKKVSMSNKLSVFLLLNIILLSFSCHKDNAEYYSKRNIIKLNFIDSKKYIKYKNDKAIIIVNYNNFIQKIDKHIKNVNSGDDKILKFIIETELSYNSDYIFSENDFSYQVHRLLKCILVDIIETRNAIFINIKNNKSPSEVIHEIYFHSKGSLNGWGGRKLYFKNDTLIIFTDEFIS